MLFLPLTHPFTTAKLLSLQATVVLLLTLLIKSKLLRVKMSLLGSLLFLSALASFAAVSGLLTLVAGGSLAYAVSQRKGAATGA